VSDQPVAETSTW